MKRLHFMKLSCAEAEKVCTKAEYKEAGFIEKLRLKLHLYFCRTCNDYYHNNKKLSNLLKKADIKTCSSQEKEAFRNKIKNGTSKGF
ncbi:hypothetical protein V5739_10605 [Salinimicrobium sp. TIG7-5_MAKvit]|uniref:hypothetical protein n=1 Tax=Salinimicrobium sp. TIG7-5_MAKvit TaxID=3121289 RepID=UPI003C6E9BCE